MSEVGESLKARVVLIGDAFVGKTCILKKLISGQYNMYENPTVGSSHEVYTVETANGEVVLQIWDTAGQERFKALGPIYYKEAQGAILVYDCSNMDSFQSLDGWYQAFRTVVGVEPPIVVAANKCDLEKKKERRVPQAMGQEWATQHGAVHYDTSVVTDENITTIFKVLAGEIVNAKLQSQGSSLQLDDVANSRRCC